MWTYKIMSVSLHAGNKRTVVMVAHVTLEKPLASNLLIGIDAIKILGGIFKLGKVQFCVHSDASTLS